MNSLGLKYDLFGILRSADRSYDLRGDHSACRNSSSQEDIYPTDNSSSSDGFLDRTSATRTFSYRNYLPPPLDLTSVKLQLNMHPRRLSWLELLLEFGVRMGACPNAVPLISHQHHRRAVPVMHPEETQQVAQRYPFSPSSGARRVK